MSKVLFFASTIFSVGTASVASLGLSDLTSQPNCPAIRCIIPTCSGNQLETPKDANGCPLCPKCVGVQTVPNVLTASVASRSTASVASRAAINLDEIDDVVSPWPCPIPMCIPPPCPEWQQEMSYNAQGCPMCRVCKPGAFTNVNAALRASANLDLDFTSVRPCPVPSCIPPSCPQWQQEIAKDDRGCPLCPVCKNTVFTAERDFVANLQLAPTPATAASFANLNFDLAARVCPLLFCTPLNCPAALQVKTTGANGCAGCPRCLDLDIRLPQERIPIPFPDPGPLLNVPVPKLNIPNTFGR